MNMPANSNDVVVRFIADSSNLMRGLANMDRALNGMSTSVGNSMKGIGSAVAVAGAVIGSAVGVAVTNATKDAVKFEAMMDNISVQLGSSADDFERWQERTGTAMGYSKLESAELANTLSSNFSGIATSQEDLFNKTTKMMEVAAIIRARTGKSMTEVSDRIRSAMNQEADGADELGVNVRVGAIVAGEAYKRMANGVPWENLSANMQKAILYQHVLTEATAKYGNQMGDNTSSRMAQFNARLGDLKLALGTAFLPILNTVIPALTAMVNWMTKATDKVVKFMEKVFGHKHKKATAESVGKETVNYEAQAKALKDVTNEKKKLDKVNKASAKASKPDNIMGFDQVHTLAKLNEAINGGGGSTSGGTTGGGTSGGTTGGGTTPSTGTPSNPNGHEVVDDSDLTPLTKMEEIILRLKEHWNKFKESGEGIWQSIKDLGQGFVDLGNTKFFKDMGTGLFEGAVLLINIALDEMGNLLDIVSGFLDIITGALTGDFSKGWGGIKKIVEGIYDVFADIVIIMSGDNPEVKKGIESFKKAFGTIFTVDFWKTSWNKSLEFFKTWDGKTFFTSNVYPKIKDAFVGTGIGQQVWGNITTAFTTGKVGDIKKWFTTNVFPKIRDAFKGTAMGSQIWGNITSGISSVGGKKITSWFSTYVASPIKKAFSGITTGIGSSITSSFKTVYNKAVGFINSMIGKLNKFGDSIDKHLPGDQIKHIPSIPKLARGGITSGPMLATIGDNVGGKEVVSPLDTLRGMIATTMNQTMNMRGGGQSSGGGTVVLNIDGREFARVIQPYTSLESKRTGNNVRLNSI